MHGFSAFDDEYARTDTAAVLYWGHERCASTHHQARAQRASTTANLATPCVTPPAQPQAEYKNGNDNCGSMGAVEKCCVLFTLCSFVGVIIILVWWYIDKNQGRPTTKYDYWSNR